MDSMYKTPSPVTAKRRLSAIPVSTGRRVVSDRITQREWPELTEEREQRARRGSIAATSGGGGGDVFRGLKEETDSVDSSMGFRELERHIAKIKRQNFDLKLELHIRREKMTANAEKLQQAERLIEENEELHETLRETRLALKARDDELVDCKALIRLLSDQLENAHNRISSFTNSPRHSSPISDYKVPTSVRKTPVLQQTEFPHEAMKLSPGSPESLRSLSESTIASASEEEDDMESSETEMQDETIIRMREQEEVHPPVREKEIRMPLRLEHSPRTTRRQSLLDEISPQRTPMYTDRRQSQISAHSQLSSNRSSRIFSDMQQAQLLSPPRESKLVTSAVSKHADAISRNTYLPPTPDVTPIQIKLPATQRTTTLRSRLFRSKSNLPEPEPQAEQIEALTVPAKQVVKKNSLIKFWKSKSSSSISERPEEQKRAKAKQISNYPPTPDKTPAVSKENIKMPHESDQLSRYPKVRPLSIATTTTTSPPNSTEWRQSIGRQVTDLVQHWEEETSRRSSNRNSAVSFTSVSTACSGKRLSRDASASPLAVKAARDAWTAKATANAAKTLAVKSGKIGGAREEKGLRGDGLRSKRDELVRKLGLSTVPPNAAAA